VTVLSDNDLMEYLLGQASVDDRQFIEGQMAKSEQLSARVASLRETLALPALAVDPVNAGQKLWSRIESSIANANPFAGFVNRLTVFLDMSEQKVTELLHSITDSEEDWHANELKGIFRKDFRAGLRHKNSQCSIVRIEPGATFPMHGHVGDEWGFVLQGEAVEDNGHKSRPGDIVYKSALDQHAITATSEEAFMFFSIHSGIILKEPVLNNP